MKSVWPLSFVILFASCSGIFKGFNQKEKHSERQIASEGMRQLMSSDATEFNQAMEQKLSSLHSYYLIGQMNLEKFDEELKNGELEDIFESETYLKLMAVRTQAEEIEHDIQDTWKALSQDKSAFTKRLNMQLRITNFAARSPYSAESLQNLMQSLDLKMKENSDFKSNKSVKKNLDAEYKAMAENKEFAVHEKNIEHLSHMMDIEITADLRKFYPDSGKQGNVVGTEFPEKVWALTFDDGPKKASSPLILKSLQDRDLKATFFQLTSSARGNNEIAKQIREAGMGIASHSYTHEQLTKVGPLVLEKEITQAVNDLEKLHGIDIKYFRLPYGAGVNNPAIRAKIAENNLIHVFWSIDTLDWMPQEPQKIVNRAMALMKQSKKDSGVILFHDIHMRTTQAGPKIMDYLKKDGRRVCTIDEIVVQMNEGAETVCPLK